MSATTASSGSPGVNTGAAAGSGAPLSVSPRPALAPLRARRDFTTFLLLLPSLLYVLAMFVYPFLYGIYLSLHPKAGTGFSFANYLAFFSDAYQWGTIWITFSFAIPCAIIVMSLALLLAYGMRRGIWMERTITTLLMLPISLGVVLLSEGIIGFYGSNGWFNQALIGAGLITEPLILTHNYYGVLLALLMQQFPFCFLMLVGYISGIDPSLEGSARVLGATPWVVFRRVMLPLIAPGMAIAFALVFVMSFAVFPSAIMLGQPAGATRTLAIAAYQQAFEQNDMSYASAIAIVMGICQMGALLVIMLFRRGLSTAATMGAGKR